jgi:serine/threonine protein phosphatase PrpC
VEPVIDCFADWSFFAVFDGHAGGKVAEYSAQNLLTTILATEQFKAVIYLQLLDHYDLA